MLPNWRSYLVVLFMNEGKMEPDTERQIDAVRVQ